ncbi:MAG: tRNA pseudouridine(55) synthase TruB [Saprospiraceae bacterium]|nr:tRNA pseudouridine(55) synthase TruB [Saprospiraceae bacterium]
MEHTDNDDPLPQRFDFLGGEMLLVNKPKGWTSFDVVNKIRYKLRQRLRVKNIKVGHAGTLDPMATGLLIICTGKFTRRIDEYQNLPKIYTGTLTLGAVTPSYDAETEVEEYFPIEHIDAEKLEAARLQFVGTIEQAPPMFSAIKVDGQPLYKRARKGEFIAVQPRTVHIERFDLTRVSLPQVSFTVHCSKGTYIRSLAYDFGKALQSGAYLSELCRTAIGPHRLEDAWEVEALIAALEVEG